MKGVSYNLSLLLSAISSLSTLIGASVPLFVKISNVTYLIFALSISGGIMAYISLVEMMSESLENFKNSDNNINPYFAQCLFFFIGVLLCGSLDYIVNKFNKNNSSTMEMDDYLKNIQKKNKGKNVIDDGIENQSQASISQNQASNENLIQPIEFETDKKIFIEEKSKVTLINFIDDENDDLIYNINEHGHDADHDLDHDYDNSSQKGSKLNSKSFHDDEYNELNNIGILTALIITLNNIPEGIVTFTSSLSNVNMGLILTFAVAIHNIPEGLSVAFPIYYSSRSKSKAFLWGALSGLSEFSSAFIEYIILRLFNIEATDFTPMIYGIIYSIIAGIMVYISFFQLLPTAIRYDNKGKTTKFGFFSGMLLMAVSLVFLNLI